MLFLELRRQWNASTTNSKNKQREVNPSGHRPDSLFLFAALVRGVNADNGNTAMMKITTVLVIPLLQGCVSRQRR